MNDDQAFLTGCYFVSPRLNILLKMRNSTKATAEQIKIPKSKLMLPLSIPPMTPTERIKPAVQSRAFSIRIAIVEVRAATIAQMKAMSLSPTMAPL